MPKYLFQASYSAEGAKGLQKEGGTKRRAAVEQLIKSVGGKLEAFYFALGESDVFLLVDAPDMPQLPLLHSQRAPLGL